MQDQAHYETLKVVLKLIINTNPPNFYMLKHNCQEMLAKLENKTPTTPSTPSTYLSQEEEEEEEEVVEEELKEEEDDELEIESFNLAMSYEL